MHAPRIRTDWHGEKTFKLRPSRTKLDLPDWAAIIIIGIPVVWVLIMCLHPVSWWTEALKGLDYLDSTAWWSVGPSK